MQALGARPRGHFLAGKLRRVGTCSVLKLPHGSNPLEVHSLCEFRGECQSLSHTHTQVTLYTLTLYYGLTPRTLSILPRVSCTAVRLVRNGFAQLQTSQAAWRWWWSCAKGQRSPSLKSVSKSIARKTLSS